MKKLKLIMFVCMSFMCEMYASSDFEIIFSGQEYKDSKELRALSAMINAEVEKHKQAYTAYSNLLAKQDKTPAEKKAILDAQRVAGLFVTFEIDHNNSDATIKKYVEDDIEARIHKSLDAKQRKNVLDSLSTQLYQVDKIMGPYSLQGSPYKKVSVSTKYGFITYIVKDTLEGDLTYPDVFVNKDKRPAPGKTLDFVIYGFGNEPSPGRDKKYVVADIEQGRQISVQEQDDFVRSYNTCRRDELSKQKEVKRMKEKAFALIDRTVKEESCMKVGGPSLNLIRSQFYGDSYDPNKKSAAQALFDQRGLTGDTKGWFSW